jgi:hypothetical protein
MLQIERYPPGAARRERTEFGFVENGHGKGPPKLRKSNKCIYVHKREKAPCRGREGKKERIAKEQIKRPENPRPGRPPRKIFPKHPFLLGKKTLGY